MFAILLLSALAQLEPLDTQAPAPNVRSLKWYDISHGGLEFKVVGFFDASKGKITWDTADERNIRSWKAAVAASKASVKPETGQVIWNFGLEPNRMSHSKSPYTAPTDTARRFIEEARSPVGGSEKFHVTVIGSDDARAPVVNDLNTHSAFADMKANMLIQSYKPDEWPVNPALGFRGNGNPTIIVQAAKGPGDVKGGRVIFKARDYSMGPAKLAEAIRKADPNYKPDLSPDGPGQGTCPIGFTHEHWPVIAGVVLLLALIFGLPERRVAL